MLAGGIAYFAFFSVFPALTLGFAIFGFVLRGHPGLFHDVVDSVSTTLPGHRQGRSPPGRRSSTPSKPPTPNALTITGAISLVVLVFSGLGWLGALREGIRAMFGQPAAEVQRRESRLRDLGVLALLGLSMLVSAVLSAVRQRGDRPGARAGSGCPRTAWPGRIVLPIVGFLVVLVVDVGDLRRAAAAAQRRADAVGRPAPGGAGRGGSAPGVLKVAVSYGIVGSSTNPVLASFAIIIGLLIVHEPDEPGDPARRRLGRVGADADRPRPTAPRQRRRRRARDDCRTRREMEPTFGARSADRTAIAAGAVIGAIGRSGVARCAGRRGDARRRIGRGAR